jgi:uridine kinase
MRPFIVGIAGGTGSGKTTLTQRLESTLGSDIQVLRHDNYYRDHPELTFEERAKLNYDHPLAFETELLIAHLQKLSQGQSIEIPAYDFTVHLRSQNTMVVQSAKIIVVEGILVLENPDLRRMMDLKIYVDADADIRILRRLLRDINERGRTLESVIDQYLGTVKPMHEQFIETTKKYADIIVPEGGHNTVALELIIARLKSVLHQN